MNNSKGSSSLFQGKVPFVGVVIMMVVVAGLVVDATKTTNDQFYSNLIRLDKVAQRIHEAYVEEMPPKDLVNNAVQGMLKILDPHTSYMNVKQFEELRIHTEGKFGGLGIQISIRDKILTVMTPIAGTPASRAGIQSGDQIITIDGKPTAGLTIDKAVEKLRGEPGTKVSITIRRKGELKDVDYTITREVIHIKSVPFYGVLDKNIGYVQLQQFSQEAGADVENAIKELLKKDIKGLVFDLRHNPGGLLPQAKEVAEKFLPRKALIVSSRGRMAEQNRDYISAASPILPENMPLIILVDYASASASEIVAGAIQDSDRGVVLGDTTFGKGSVQSLLPVDNEYHLKITTAFYYTPSGRCINKPENAIRGTAAELESESPLDNENPEASADTVTKSEKAKKDTTTYKTNNGRLVYGGGGIIPDTIVDLPIPNMVIRTLMIKEAFFQFANIEYPKLKQRKIKIDKDFVVDKSITKDFYTFLDSIKFTYQSLPQIRFEDFKKHTGMIDSLKDTTDPLSVLEKLNWINNEKAEFKKAITMIDSLLTRESRRSITEQDSSISMFIREALINREFGQDHEISYRLKLANDAQLSTAIALITDQAKYSSLLKPRPVSNKNKDSDNTKKDTTPSGTQKETKDTTK